MIFCMPFLSIARVLILGAFYGMLNSKHHNKLIGLITKAIEINTQERDRDIDREKCIYVNTETEREGGTRETETERENKTIRISNNNIQTKTVIIPVNYQLVDGYSK